MKKYQLNQGARDVLAKMIVTSRTYACEAILKEYGEANTKMWRNKVDNSNTLEKIENNILNYPMSKRLKVSSKDQYSFKAKLCEEVREVQDKVYNDNLDFNLWRETIRQDLQDGQGIQMQG